MRARIFTINGAFFVKLEHISSKLRNCVHLIFHPVRSPPATTRVEWRMRRGRGEHQPRMWTIRTKNRNASNERFRKIRKFSRGKNSNASNEHFRKIRKFSRGRNKNASNEHFRRFREFSSRGKATRPLPDTARVRQKRA